MNKTLMVTVSVAALVAAGGMAFAQGVNEPREKPAVAAPMQGGRSDQLKVETPRKTEAAKPDSNAQLPAKPTRAKSETSGQGTGMQPVQRDATPPGDRSAPKVQEKADSKVDSKVDSKADAKHAGPAALSGEQHAKIWESIRAEKTARFTGEKFSMTVGEMVPQTVHLNRLSARVIEFAPQYRGYEYIQVGENILIVDPRTHRIVAVIEA